MQNMHILSAVMILLPSLLTQFSQLKIFCNTTAKRRHFLDDVFLFTQQMVWCHNRRASSDNSASALLVEMQLLQRYNYRQAEASPQSVGHYRSSTIDSDQTRPPHRHE